MGKCILNLKVQKNCNTDKSPVITTSILFIFSQIIKTHIIQQIIFQWPDFNLSAVLERWDYQQKSNEILIS